jgi:predicted transposase YbfD/YdcC
VIAIDGKTVRGARGGQRSALHLVADLAPGSGPVIGQLAVSEKSDEIPTARDLLAVLDLAGAVVTMDAVHTQHDTATVITKGKRTVEVVYLVTSADAATAPPETLATWIQGHWEVENRLHWVRDVTFDEDRSQVRTGNAPRVMASLRNTAITLLRIHGHENIAAALRHHARDATRPINLLLTA